MNQKAFCSMLLLLLPLFSLKGQEAYMGQILITDQSFSLSGEQLHIQMDINYEGLQIPSDEFLTLTPFLGKGEHTFNFPSILINSTDKPIYKHTRTPHKASDINKEKSSTPSVILKNGHNSSRRFTYKVTIPFREWMVRASFVLHTEESGCNGKKSKSYDEIASDIMFDIKVSELEKNVDVRCLSWVNFVTVALESTDFSLSTIGNGRITPECLFILANNYTLGSAEFNDIYDLAARLFPDSSEAGINAAAVALGKRDIRKTRKYISRFSTCQTAFNNMGVLCMLEGNYEKAELYLEMAVAAGIERASEVLVELRNRRNL